MTPERFGLNEIERRTPLWFALKTHMEQRRQHLREQNDSPGLDERKTAELRGRIAMLTELLALERKD